MNVNERMNRLYHINTVFSCMWIMNIKPFMSFCVQVFIKSELKVGVIYVKEGQYTEEEILDNNDTSPLFEEFLQILGEKVRLKGFDKYKGGLDTVHDLTGLYSVYTHWRGIEIMFHVSTLLPYEKNDPQKVRNRLN